MIVGGSHVISVIRQLTRHDMLWLLLLLLGSRVRSRSSQRHRQRHTRALEIGECAQFRLQRARALSQ